MNKYKVFSCASDNHFEANLNKYAERGYVLLHFHRSEYQYTAVMMLNITRNESDTRLEERLNNTTHTMPPPDLFLNQSHQ
jgi:hypothetical protein